MLAGAPGYCAAADHLIYPLSRLPAWRLAAARSQHNKSPVPLNAGLHAYGLDILEVLADGSVCIFDLHQPTQAMLPADLANLEDTGASLALHILWG